MRMRSELLKTQQAGKEGVFLVMLYGHYAFDQIDRNTYRPPVRRIRTNPFMMERCDSQGVRGKGSGFQEFERMNNTNAKRVGRKGQDREGVFSVMLHDHDAFRLITDIERRIGFGLHDTIGTLEPCSGATQWNWQHKGLYVTCFYKEPRWRGIADILIISTTPESTRLMRSFVG